MASGTAGGYTSEQESMCRNIMAKKNFYEILGVGQSASDDELKKSYRKLALKMHPDKNKAPSATEAFKNVSKAFACLSDGEKRKHYDMYGEETPLPAAGHGRRGHHHAYYEDEFDPDEIFRMFFGGNIFSQQGAVYRRNVNRQPRAQAGPQQNANAFLQLLPVLLLLAISMFNNWANPDLSTYYSFSETRTHQVQKVSNNFSVTYYIDLPGVESFRNPADTFRKIDSEVEEVYIQDLKRECYQKTSYRDRMNAAVRYYGKDSRKGREYLDKVHNIDLTSCEDLNNLMPRSGYGRVY